MNKTGGLLQKLREHALLNVSLLSAVALLIGGYFLIESFRLDPNTVAAVAGAIAALAGALAAFAALGAARESRKTARDATRALALATKPIPDIRMIIERSQTQLDRCTMHIEIENLATHPVRGGTLTWMLRDGTSGSQQVGLIAGRSKPYGGLIHRAEGVQRLLAAEKFDSGIAGMDRVTFDYWGDTRLTRWRSTLALEWEVLPNQWGEKDGVLIPATTRKGYERSDIEL